MMYILILLEYTVTSMSDLLLLILLDLSKFDKICVYKLFYSTYQEYQFKLQFRRGFIINKSVSYEAHNS